MKVTVFGIGYVGLVQAATLAEVGHDVVCVDIDAARIATLAAGTVPIFEIDLEAMVRRNLKDGRLHFTTDAAAGVAHAPLIFVAVGTPAGADGRADLRYVDAVVASIGTAMAEPKTVVLKSTVPIGTGDAVAAALRKTLDARGRGDLGAEIVANPEFLREGSAVEDSMKPDRIIVGTTSAEAERLLRRLYAPFNRNDGTIIVMDRRSAELTKDAANAMLAAKISYMNEMAAIAEAYDADVEKVRRGVGADPRIGMHFTYPGIGYGGSCFPKDVNALIRIAEDGGVAPLMLSAIQQRNDSQKRTLVRKLERHFGGALAGRTFALWGLSFKPNTDDMRDAPSRAIMEALWTAGARIQAYDPVAMEECARLYPGAPGLVLCATKEQALAGADALIIATEWKAFQSVDLDSIRAALRQPVIFDGRNIYDPALAAEAGLTYYGIGRGTTGRRA